MSLILNAANVLDSIAGGIAAETATAGAGAAITGAISLNEVLRRLAGKAPAINARIAADLEAEMAAHHLTEAQKTLIPQMIERAPLTPVEVMEAARNPARIAKAMLAKHTDPAHQIPANADALRRTVIPVLTRLLADQTTSDALRPAFENAVAESLRFIGEQVETLTAQFKDAIERATVAEFVVKELARRFVPGAGGDFETARRDLEKALEIYVTQQALGALPHNHGDAIDLIFDEVNRLNALAQFDKAAEALDLALQAEREEREALQQASIARQAAILDRGVEQDRLRNNPASAAQRLVERLLLDTPDESFVALRALQDEWYERGRDQGLAFDATVAIHLAEHSLSCAQTPDQRGEALNDLGIALQTLGAREAGSARLEQAVAAYESALLERTRDRVPLDWATTQNNLGNALATLGEREAGTARLEQAITAYEAALLERTRDRVPLNWATTQNNLGNALQTLGEREAGTTRLEQALTAYESALLERTRERVPLDWATTQNNLGTALQTLGAREAGSARLEQAVAAYESALLERTRDRVPLDWAMTQGNLAIVDIAFFDKTMDSAHLARARDHVMAAREVFVAAGADHYIGMTNNILADITEREQA